MTIRTAVRVVAALLCAALLPTATASAEQIVRCESEEYRYRYCTANTEGRVQLVRQLSKSRCVQGNNWDFDRRGIWVDRGCAAEFKVGRDYGGHRGEQDFGREEGRTSGQALRRGPAVAAGVSAIIGLTVAAAIVSNLNRQQGEVDAWAVGTFEGFDQFEDTDVAITILPGGSVNGRAGDNSFTGRFAGNRLEAGRQRFTVQRSGNGFLATDEDNAGHQVMFRRSGGY